jgi:predicted amidophosphoribosyltransferase
MKQCATCLNQKKRKIDICAECLLDQMLSIIPNSCPACCAPCDYGSDKCFDCQDFELQNKDYIDDIIPITYGIKETDISYMVRGLKDFGNSAYFVPLASILYKFLISNIDKMIARYEKIDYLTYIPSFKNLRNHNNKLINSVKFNKLKRVDLLIEPKVHSKRQGTKRENRKVEIDRYILGEDYNLDGKTILLFDDVCTTGSTLHSAAYPLKQKGAEKVIGLVIFKQVYGQYVDEIKEFTRENGFSYDKWKYDFIQ